MAKVGVKYEGLHKRDTYEGLIDYLESKQEKIKFPNRDAKFVRDSPQYQSLLNEGFVEVEEQQLKQIKEEQAEHAVIRTANDTNETAKEVKVVAAQTQTDKPLIVKTNSRATQSLDVKTKSTYSQASPQIFDMTVNDNMSKFKQDVESVEDTQQQNKQHQEQMMNRILQNHLKDEATPGTTDFAHKIASVASSSIQSIGQGLRHLSSSTKQNAKAHDTSLLLGDGRGKQDYYVINTPQLTVGDKLPHKKKEQSKSKAMEIDDAVEKSKPKAKPGPGLTVDEQEMFDEIYENIQPKSKPKSAGFPKPPPKNPPKTKPQPKAKTSMPPVIKRDKATKGTTKPASGLTTGVQIPPSKIGIQKLREELENAKNKSKLTAQDTSDYMKMYDNWLGAKGDKAMKDTSLKGLRDIYKRVLYKKN